MSEGSRSPLWNAEIMSFETRALSDIILTDETEAFIMTTAMDNDQLQLDGRTRGEACDATLSALVLVIVCAVVGEAKNIARRP